MRSWAYRRCPKSPYSHQHKAAHFQQKRASSTSARRAEHVSTWGAWTYCWFFPSNKCICMYAGQIYIKWLAGMHACIFQQKIIHDIAGAKRSWNQNSERRRRKEFASPLDRRRASAAASLGFGQPLHSLNPVVFFERSFLGSWPL